MAYGVKGEQSEMIQHSNSRPNDKRNTNYEFRTTNNEPRKGFFLSCAPIQAHFLRYGKERNKIKS